MVTTIGRRSVLNGALAMSGSMLASQRAEAAAISPGTAEAAIGALNLRIIDLTHQLTTAFNWIPSRPRIAMDPIVGSGFAVGMNLNRLMLIEHTGTHIDVPRHFDNAGKSLGEIPIGDLVVPLAVIDFKVRAASDPDAGLGPDDILEWEKQHGRLPNGCCVSLNSGFDPLARIRDAAPGRRTGSPGLSPEGSKFLIAERQVKGVAVDAMSIDQGKNGPAYPVHQEWLKSGRWGIEGLTNLDAVPALGALLFVGAPPVADATGMPVRAIAMFDARLART